MFFLMNSVNILKIFIIFEDVLKILLISMNFDINYLFLHYKTLKAKLSQMLNYHISCFPPFSLFSPHIWILPIRTINLLNPQIRELSKNKKSGSTKLREFRTRSTS